MASPPGAQAALTLEHAEVWAFDLDNTLYPASCNLLEQMKEQVRKLISEQLGVDYQRACRLQEQYLHQYGTALRGLSLHHGITAEMFFRYVHAIDYDALQRDHSLDAALSQLGGRKLVHTNGARDHAERVLDRLGCRHHFELIFDIVDAGFQPKPHPSSFGQFLKRAGVRAHRVVMIDDVPQNLATAATLGMTTVWLKTDGELGSDVQHGAHIHHVTEDLAGWLQAVVAARATGQSP